MTNGNGSGLSFKGFMAMAGITATLVGTAMVGLSPFVIEKARVVAREEVRERSLHANAVSRQEWGLILQRLDNLATSADVRILQAKIESIEAKISGK